MPPARPPRPRLLAFGIVAAVLAGGVATAAPALIERIDESATSDAAARAVQALGDVVNVSNVGELHDDLAVSALDAAREAGAAATISRGASIGMLRVMRGSEVVQEPGGGYRIPMAVTAMAPAAIAGVMGRDLSGALVGDTVVMGERTAGLRGAQAGDRIELVAADGSTRWLTVTVVAPDDRVGGTELLMTTATAGSLGITIDTSVVIWGIPSRAALEAAFGAHGLLTRHETRIDRSWAPRRPDATLGSARTKELLGEFSYQPTSGDTVVQDAAWVAASLPSGRVLLSNAIQVRARCHNRLLDDLGAALDEVAAAGLAGAIDLANTNTYGGCHNPRFNRISGQLGFLSRHAWGQAFDTNTVTNCQGCVPKMNCDVVRIFRRHNFAWGGNFLRPDGMHFEWVGERRDQIPSPGGYCPNAVTATTESLDAAVAAVGDMRATMFAEVPDLDDHADDHDDSVTAAP